MVDRHPAGAAVRRRPASYIRGVGHGVVVAQDRPQLLVRIVQVEPVRAEVTPGSERRVEHVLWIGDAVTVAIAGIADPGARQELHRAYGTDETSGITDGFVAGQCSVQQRPEYR